MIAPKLQPGDEVRVISPSRSLSIIDEQHIQLAKQRLEASGLIVSFSANAYEMDDFASSSIESRIQDLHAAFADPQVKGILATIGGFNSNQLLQYIDYSLIQANPKRFCGYSDITALSTAIYTKTGLITYSGPAFSTFAILHGNEYTVEFFEKMMMESADSILVTPSEAWSDDAWYRDQENRQFITNQGSVILNEGQAEGTIIGGNLCTLNLLQGTEYMPSLEGTVLFVEDDYMADPSTFDRDLQSLIHQPGFEQVRGLVIGRFQKASGMTPQLLEKIIHSKRELTQIPVIADVDFGHTAPHFTFPIGGKTELNAQGTSVELWISEYMSE
ncbi:S66 family peptidase [Paenibacillus xylanexedens]|uniref:S66 family peptidase n=1 Tax=Paenibacillus xylanexedens TaxID=528191 RepID=UPI00119E26E4|nr:S66 peptidase family protein [Paenibacillus xylanexedens]